MVKASEINDLREVSARIGGEPLLVQAATGNTSLKLDGILWVKASGNWLANAIREEIFIPVNLAETQERIGRGIDPSGQSATLNGKPLCTSIETSMHAVLPYRVVLHVHSVNTIALAVRRDGQAALSTRLEGIDWQWIPYVPSGLALAHAVEAALARAPRANVFVLANHGLIVCGDDCDSTEALLREVERRVASTPRRPAEPRWQVLARIAGNCDWRVPQDAAIHVIATDFFARQIAAGGVLYPCQAIFLTPRARVFPQSIEAGCLGNEPFAIIEDAGVLVRARPNAAESAALAGLAEILRRIPENAPVQYLPEDQVRGLLSADVYRYREMVEGNWNNSSPNA